MSKDKLQSFIFKAYEYAEQIDNSIKDQYECEIDGIYEIYRNIYKKKDKSKQQSEDEYKTLFDKLEQIVKKYEILFKNKIKEIYDSSKLLDKKENVKNSLRHTETCVLRNNKKEKYYIHTYDPSYLLHKLKTEFQHSDEILYKFDDQRKENCCNVISISLYLKNCNTENIDKYISSIHRTVLNVKHNLKDWLVRVYLDTSVYNCLINKGDIQFSQLFLNIVHSENVEIYTIECPSIICDEIPIAKTRTFRFLPLIDEEVNIAIIREADGIVSNLDCHNIKIYSKLQNKLFYLPLYSFNDNINTYRFTSYSEWLILYKLAFEQQFFLNNQNLYDLLAGGFGIKLKLKKEYYLFKIKDLIDKIINFTSEIQNDNIKLKDIINVLSFNENPRVFHYLLIEPYSKTFNEYLNIGFDEIFLLDVYKEIISFKIEPSITIDTFKCDKYSRLIPSKNDIFKIDSIISTGKNKIIELDTYNEKEIPKILQKECIIRSIKNIEFSDRYSNIEFQKKDIACKIDSILYDNIIYDDTFDIKIKNDTKIEPFPKYLLWLINQPYKLEYDSFYNIDDSKIKQKYLKYKNKYLQLKSKFAL